MQLFPFFPRNYAWDHGTSSRIKFIAYSGPVASYHVPLELAGLHGCRSYAERSRYNITEAARLRLVEPFGLNVRVDGDVMVNDRCATCGRDAVEHHTVDNLVRPGRQLCEQCQRGLCGAPTGTGSARRHMMKRNLVRFEHCFERLGFHRWPEANPRAETLGLVVIIEAESIGKCPPAEPSEPGTGRRPIRRSGDCRPASDPAVRSVPWGNRAVTARSSEIPNRRRASNEVARIRTTLE